MKPPRVVGWASDPLSQSRGRLEAARQSLDERAAETLTYHALIEVELRALLAALVRDVKPLDRFHFSNLVMVLRAVHPGNPGARDRLALALEGFNKLRNSIAHGDRRASVDGHHRDLSATLLPELPGELIPIADLAAQITLWLSIATLNAMQPAPPSPPPATP